MLESIAEGDYKLRRKSLVVGVALALVLNIASFVARRQHTARGEMVRLASDSCSWLLDDKVIHLHVSNDGSLKINSDTVQDKELVRLLSEVYAVRAERILYLSAANDVSYQRILDVIDDAQNLQFPNAVPQPPALKHVDRISLEVRLLTRKAMERDCSHGCLNWTKEHIVSPAR